MAIPPTILKAYDPARFRTDGHRLIDALAAHLERWHAREGQVLPWREPGLAKVMWAESTTVGDFVDDLARIAGMSTALANPRCMGHQVAPPLPGAALAELVSALLNNGMAVYEMGPASVPIELCVIEWMCGALGLPSTAGGVMTSGGSLGNLTALLAMRQSHAGFDVWKAGGHGGPPLAVIASSEAHYSVSRALRIMGWGEGGVIAAPVDAQHRLTGAAVEYAIEEAEGRRVIGIVASAGSTATGAFDPLVELANVAARHKLWLHVDAAHGASVALSQTHKHKLAGIERADSIVWDAHKLLMMPALVTAVLFKREASSYEAFAQQASYLFANARPEKTWWDLGQRTLECTKRMMAIEVWTALRAHGEPFFSDVVDRQIALATELATKLAATTDFEVAIKPESNIVCYRHKPPKLAGAELDAHNRQLRQRVVEDGKFYVVGLELPPRGFFLRSTIMNPLTESRDLDELIEHLRALCPS